MGYRAIKIKLENNKRFSFKELRKYAYIRIGEENIYRNVGSVVITRHGVNSYDEDKKEITLNEERIYFDRAEKIPSPLKTMLCNNRRRNPQNVMASNIYNIHAINYLIRLAYQRALIERNDFSKLKELIVKSDIINWVDHDVFGSIYLTNYKNYMFQEYDANIHSFLETIYLLNSYNLNNLSRNIVELNQICALQLLRCYTSYQDKNSHSTPYDNLTKMYEEIFKKLKENGIDIEEYYYDFSRYDQFETSQSQLDRLRLGLPINDEVMNHITDVSTGKKKTLNMFEDIRCN